jgi:N-acyl-D-amino-acid deacylase
VAGKTLGQIANDMGLTSEEALLVIIENGGSATMVFEECIDGESLKVLSAHALGMVSTNGSGYSEKQAENKNLVHPRCFGTTAKFILETHLTDSRLSIEEAVRKLSGLPALKIGISDRGTIEIGKKADVLILDLERMQSKATLKNPFQYQSGISHAWVNGVKSVFHGELISQMAGRFLKKLN